MAAEFYVNRPSAAVLDAARMPADVDAAYHAALEPKALIAAALEDPEVARAARSYGDHGKRVWELANEVVDKLYPIALGAVRAFDKFERFAGPQTERASRIAFHVMRPMFGIAIKVLGWAVRLTSPATSRIMALGLKVTIPEIIVALGLPASPLLALSDPRAKQDIRPGGDRARRAGIAMLHVKPVRFRYRDGAAFPDDMREHLGFLATDLQRAAGIGDGHAVPVMDVLAAQTVALQMVDGHVAEMQAQIRALRRMVGLDD